LSVQATVIKRNVSLREIPDVGEESNLPEVGGAFTIIVYFDTLVEDNPETDALKTNV